MEGDGKGKVGLIAGGLAAIGMIFARSADDCGRMGARTARFAGEEAVAARALSHADDLGVGAGRYGRLGAAGALGEVGGLPASGGRLATAVDDGLRLGDDALGTVAEESLGLAVDAADLMLSLDDDSPADPMAYAPDPAILAAWLARRVERPEVLVAGPAPAAGGAATGRITTAQALDRAVRASLANPLVVVAAGATTDSETLALDDGLPVRDVQALCLGLSRNCVVLVCEGGEEACLAEGERVARDAIAAGAIDVDALVGALVDGRDASPLGGAMVLHRVGLRGLSSPPQRLVSRRP